MGTVFLETVTADIECGETVAWIAGYKLAWNTDDGCTKITGYKIAWNTDDECMITGLEADGCKQ
jgi:hypothetical protein